MGVLDGYYLYCDLDGTLLDDEKRVSAENREAILNFIRQGGHFGLATGRVPGGIGAVERDLPINAPCILYNGAGLYDFFGQRFLAMHPIDRDRTELIAGRLIELNGKTCIQVYTDSSIYEINPDQRDDPQTVIERIQTRAEPFDNISGPLLKVLIAQTSDNIDVLHTALVEEGLFDELSAFRSASTYLEFVAKGVSKGTTLADVRTFCKDVKKILAIGDYNNDLEMISLADIGGAPANAIHEVKAAADIVLAADNNHSCVARFLEAALG